MSQSLNSSAYIGIWVTEDGYIRHELLANGRYDEPAARNKVPIKVIIRLMEIRLITSMIRGLPLMENFEMEFSITLE